MSDGRLWEVFLRARNGAAHKHVGSLRAPDAAIALQFARDLYTRRGEGVSLWVAPSAAIAASDPAGQDALTAVGEGKIYRHPDFYQTPEGVERI